MSEGTGMNLEDHEPQEADVERTVDHGSPDSPPMSYSVKVPSAIVAIPEAELDRQVVFTLDQCVIDNKAFYIRGRIPVPVIGREDPFIWGVWAQVGEPDFVRTNRMWRVEGREAEPPYRGWLNTPIPIYPNTLNLELRILTQVVGRRPHFELTDATHPLAAEQRSGMTMERVKEL
ncbi:MAG TPA: DUF2199 domain-containing protein [Bryobacteraceae bacterium]|nr:DUF2199 domain-containing protein [Bryobacteraceae bacterium]